jgi:hypothetical protein
MKSGDIPMCGSMRIGMQLNLKIAEPDHHDLWLGGTAEQIKSELNSLEI